MRPLVNRTCSDGQNSSVLRILEYWDEVLSFVMQSIEAHAINWHCFKKRLWRRIRRRSSHMASEFDTVLIAVYCHIKRRPSGIATGDQRYLSVKSIKSSPDAPADFTRQTKMRISTVNQDKPTNWRRQHFSYEFRSHFPRQLPSCCLSSVAAVDYG